MEGELHHFELFKSYVMDSKFGLPMPGDKGVLRDSREVRPIPELTCVGEQQLLRGRRVPISDTIPQAQAQPEIT